jgi:hypothetical protein
MCKIDIYSAIKTGLSTEVARLFQLVRMSAFYGPLKLKVAGSTPASGFFILFHRFFHRLWRILPAEFRQVNEVDAADMSLDLLDLERRAKVESLVRVDAHPTN